ncbi:transmembrane and coiled-coil domain-containing protein 4-like isoform X2 [Panonychus citri]|uniref:transmembrane and coiled-coil domain-containing protein 4-like isoform X2 n=1 Tax=Panonychus citri TaxID=50023 RepID=UPI0023075259|nr:transmembrane and coiled-coil domain-containing protein 4-like isoform X2 [Panonychus citri]
MNVFLRCDLNTMDDTDETCSNPSSLGYNSLSSQSEPLTSLISDAGIYSLCGLTALAFCQLFPDEWDQQFREDTLESLIKHLGLPLQIKNSMNALMSGEGGDINAFANLLREEKILQTTCLKVIEELVLFAVREGVYDSRMRVLVLYVANVLGVPVQLVELFEESVIEMLTNDVPSESEEDVKEKAKRRRNKKIKRYFMIGLAGLGGGAIIGLTGGLAAPFVAAGAGAIIGGAGAAALGSTAGIAVIGSLFGVAGAGLTGYKMKKRVGDIEEFAFDKLSDGRELHITIAVSGWISEEGPKAFQEPWRTLQNTREQYCIRYESAFLLELGRALDYFLGFAVSVAAQEALKYTILSGIMAAIAWPTSLVTLASVIDNPWGVCIRRSAEVGKHLAEILISRQQGRRPVTLIGFSLGARAIFYCLQELVSRKGSEGIIEDVILLGAPVAGNAQQWKQFSRVVSGRVVNGYCRGDWLLKFLYRTSTATLKIAGLAPVDWKDRRMCNIDLSEIVSGHMDYYRKMSSVLKAVGVRTKERTKRKAESLYMKKCLSDLPIKDYPDDSIDPVDLIKYFPEIRLSISEPNLQSISRKFKLAANDDETNDEARANIISQISNLRRTHSMDSISSRSYSRSSGVAFTPSSSASDYNLMKMSASRSFNQTFDSLAEQDTENSFSSNSSIKETKS